MVTTINESHILVSGLINIRYISIKIYFIFKSKDTILDLGGLGLVFFCFVSFLGWCFCNQRPLTRIQGNKNSST